MSLDFNRMFPIKYWADRIKQSSTITEMLDLKLYDQAAYQLLGEDLAERLKTITIEVRKDKELLHFKPKYPFGWGCIR